MGLISAIKSALGLDDSRDRSGGSRGTDVTVERETDATTERAVKESDAGTDTTTTGATGEEGGAESTAEASASGGETATDEREVGTADDDTGEGEPVDAIKGIGPAYAERLAGAGINTVSDLADADAADVDEATGIGENRLQKWIDRANAR